MTLTRAAKRIDTVLLYGVQGLYHPFSFTGRTPDCRLRTARRDAEQARLVDSITIRPVCPLPARAGKR